MNKRHYEHTLPNIRGSLSNTYESAKENLAGLIIRSAGPSDIRRGTAGQKRRILPPPGSVMIF